MGPQTVLLLVAFASFLAGSPGWALFLVLLVLGLELVYYWED